MESYGNNITRQWMPVNKCRNIHTNMVTEPIQDGEPNMIDMPAMDDHESTNLIDTDLKAKVTPRPGGSSHSQGGNRPTSNSACERDGTKLVPVLTATAILVATSRIVIRLI